MNRQSKFLTKVVPMALTILGAASTIAAVIFAAKEGPKYQKILEENKEMSTPKKVVKAAKTFAPAIGCAAVSVACGIGAHCLDMSTQASLTGAYIAAQGGFKKLKGEYKKFRDKNRELNGEEANEKIFKEMQKDDLPADLRDEDGEKVYTVHLTNIAEDVEDMTFQDSLANVLGAMLTFHVIINSDIEFVTLNQFLGLFGQSEIPFGEEEGWSIYMLFQQKVNRGYFNFKRVTETNEIFVGPVVPAYGGFLTDFGLDY